jgi:hypothetical protein
LRRAMLLTPGSEPIKYLTDSLQHLPNLLLCLLNLSPFLD